MYSVKLSKHAQKQLDNLPTSVQARLISVVDALSVDPRPPGVKALKGSKGLLRLRVGDYRVIFQIEDKLLSVLVVEIGHRREVYRRR